MRKLCLLPATALLMTLGACGGTTNRGLESVHQPVVSRRDFVYDMPATYAGASSERLAAWFDSLNMRYGDRVSVDDPSGSAANRSAVASVASRYGLLVADSAPVTQGAIAPGSFRVVVSRSIAEVPGCPDWSRSSQFNYSGDAPSNYGCATNASMAAMVANPEDLVSGRKPGTTTDNITSRNAIRKVKGAN